MSSPDVGKQALLIEDDAFTRYVMQHVAKTLGHKLDVAENGQQGLDAIRDNPDAYSLILLDLHLPGLSGFETSEAIRALPDGKGSDIPIFAVTADSAYYNDDVISKLGLTGYAPKPVTPGRLKALLDEYCDTI